MIVYHGSDMIVSHPDVSHTTRHLDFGDGFYVIENKQQAERWAKRKALALPRAKCFVNCYDCSDVPGYKIKDFADALDSWLDFVCLCRDGSDIYRQYDIIRGKVADDKVFRVVDLYKKGIWDKARTLQEMRVYESYNQTAFITQAALDASLTYVDSYEAAP